MESCETLIEVGLKSGEHFRTNHLHRECLAQALRLHEAETLAAQDYHRREVEMSNEQHRRKVLQERYIHEEDIDKEKSIATRDNIRDDWLQLAARAETVLIVNTLVLAVAFAMLIEGNLPPSATVTNPILTVAYFSAIASSICLLFGSVRFAVLLRLRVTITIVREMRDAIEASGREDNNFRKCNDYKWVSSPWRGQPACDDKHLSTHSYLLQLRERYTDPELELASERPPADPASSHRGSPAVEEPPGLPAPASTSLEEVTHQLLPLSFVHNRVPRGFEDLGWIASDATGYSVRHACKSFWTWLKPSLPQVSWTRTTEASASSLPDAPIMDTGEEYFSLVVDGREDALHDAAVAAAGDASAAGARAEDVPSAPEEETSGPSMPRLSPRVEAPQERGDVAIHEPLRLSPEKGVDEIEREGRYRSRVKERTKSNDDSQERLKTLQINRCKPWEDAAQKLMSAGSVFLLLAASILVFGRFFFLATSLSPAEAIPGSDVACWAFTAPCVLTVIVLAYLEALRQEWQAEQDRDRRLADKEKNRSGHQKSALRRSAVQISAQAEDKQHAVLFTSFLLYGMLLSFATFVIIAFVQSLPTDVGHRAAAEELALKQLAPLVATRLSLAAGTAWPHFWEPSGAAWLPEQQVLLLVGAGDVVAAAISGNANDTTLFLSSTSRLKADKAAPLVDICLARSGQGSSWLLAVDAGFGVYATEVGAASMGGWSDRTFVPVVSASKTHGAPSAGLPEQQVAMSNVHRKVLACQGVGLDGSVQIWLSGNLETWPLLSGAKLGSGMLHGQVPAEVEPANITQHWQTRWLLEEPGVIDMYGLGGVTIEAVEAAPTGGLLVLLSTGESTGGASRQQLLVAVGAGGHVLRSWVLAPPEGGTKWVAFAVAREKEDGAGRHLLLVAGGPTPIVATVKMPAEYL